jgi:GTP-binding protein HflX
MLEKEVLNSKNSIVGIVTQNQSEEKLKEYDELEFLTLRQVDK